MSRMRRSDDGQALVEAAFVLPAFVFLLLVALQLTQLQQARILADHAAFAAARAGIVMNGDPAKMRDAAVLAVLSGVGPTDGAVALARTLIRFKAEEAALGAFGLEQMRVHVHNPVAQDFPVWGQHLHGEEIDFDDVRPGATDATLLSLQIRWLYELKVLVAIFGLVLMLCVLGTVNLGRTVYDRIQLQAAADSAAYSQAAMEARVMNFTAYTNRAMVAHYASVMAATSYLTWLHFIWAGLKPLLEILGEVLFIGPIAAAIENGLSALIRVIDAGVAALSPLLSAANMLLYGLQEGAWQAVWARLARSLPPEAHSGDSAARPYQTIWPAALPLANQAVFAQTRGHLTMPQDAAETLQSLTNAKDKHVQQARLHMLEIANSARQPWVAYGDRYGDPTLSPMARHFRWGFSIGVVSLQLGSVGRTEMGAYAPRSGLQRGQTDPPKTG